MLFEIFSTTRLLSLPSVYQRLRVNLLPSLTSLICFSSENIEIIDHCCIIICAEHMLILIIWTFFACWILAVLFNYVHWMNLVSSCSLDVKADWERMNQQHCVLPDVLSKWRSISQEHITSQYHCTFFSGIVRQRCRNRLLTVLRPMLW